MKHYATYIKVIAFTLCIIPLVAMADTAATLRQLQIDLLWYSQVLTSGVLTPEKATEVMAGLSAISAQLAELSREPGIGGSSVFAPEAARRTDIKSIIVFGNAITMGSTVEVVYNEELVGGVLLPPATSTLRLVPAPTSYAESEIGARTNDLMLHAKLSVLPGLALAPEKYDELVQYSIRQFESKAAVEAFLQKVGKDNFPITIGTLSQITDISLEVGLRHFHLNISSSQNEKIILTLDPSTYYCKDETCIRPGRYNFDLQYVVHGVIVQELTDTNFSNGDIRDEIIKQEILKGIGSTYTPAKTDRTVITELVNFAVGSDTYYQDYGRSRTPIGTRVDRSETCHPPHVKEAMLSIIDFLLSAGAMQVAAPLSSITTIYAPLVASDDINIRIRCELPSNDKFPSFK